MPIQIKNLQQQELPLQGQHGPFGLVTRIPESVHPQPSELLYSHQHVSTNMRDTSLPYTQRDLFTQDYKNSHVPVIHKVISTMQGSKVFVSSPLMDSINVLTSKAEGHSIEGRLQADETSDRSCSSFPIGDTVMQEHYRTFKTTLPDRTSRSHRTEDLEMHNSIEEFVNPAIPLQEDMETCNDSSSNELMDSEENGKEHALKR